MTGVSCTSESERVFTLEERWYADEEIQAGAETRTEALGLRNDRHYGSGLPEISGLVLEPTQEVASSQTEKILTVTFPNVKVLLPRSYLSSMVI